VEEPNLVKDIVKEFFKNKMSVVESVGVRLDNVTFKTISPQDNMLLTAPFEDIEIKEVIWE